MRTGTSRVSTSTLTLGGLRAADEIEADAVVVMGEAVELQPEHVGRDFGHLLDCCAAGDAERIGHARGLRRLGHDEIGARPHQRRPAHGRDAERRGIAAAEQFNLDRRQARHHAVARHDFHRVERRPVVRDADIVAGAGVAIFEGETRHVGGRPPAQIGRGRETPVQRRKARAARTAAAATASRSCRAWCFLGRRYASL